MDIFLKSLLCIILISFFGVVLIATKEFNKKLNKDILDKKKKRNEVVKKSLFIAVYDSTAVESTKTGVN